VSGAAGRVRELGSRIRYDGERVGRGALPWLRALPGRMWRAARRASVTVARRVLAPFSRPAAQLAVLAWIGSLVLYAHTVHHGATTDPYPTVIGGSMLMLVGLALPIYILVSPGFADLPLGAFIIGYAVMFLSVVTAFAAMDYAMSHALLHVPAHDMVVVHGGHTIRVHVPAHFAAATSSTPAQYLGCFDDGTNDAVLRGSTAVYFALGTLTTAGTGQLTAHSTACRDLTAGQLGVGLPLLGLAVAGLGAKLFRELSASELAARRTAEHDRRRERDKRRADAKAVRDGRYEAWKLKREQRAEAKKHEREQRAEAKKLKREQRAEAKKHEREQRAEAKKLERERRSRSRDADADAAADKARRRDGPDTDQR